MKQRKSDKRHEAIVYKSLCCLHEDHILYFVSERTNIMRDKIIIIAVKIYAIKSIEFESSKYDANEWELKSSSTVRWPVGIGSCC